MYYFYLFQKLFSQVGALEVCRVDQDNFGRSLTTATVIYHSAQNATDAISSMNKHKIMNSIITV
jgi:RNA recognition motif-containing protein